MTSDTLERAAYIAAHRIMQADLDSPQFACAGTRRSRTVDAIAGIIKDVMEAEEQPLPLPDWTQHLYETETLR